jgi:hypothetical protein
MRAFPEFHKQLELQIRSIVQTIAAMKGDDVVDDEACDEVVNCTQRIVAAFNDFADVNSKKSYKIEPPEDLEPSPYQEDQEEDDD